MILARDFSIIEPMEKIDLSHAIMHLKAAIVNGSYGLRCVNDAGEPVRLNNKGHLFSTCFIAEAIGDSLNEIERTILLTRLLSEEVNGLWGYAPRGYRVTEANNPFLVDSDDTAFAIRAFKALDVYKDPSQLTQFFNPIAEGYVTFNAGEGVDPSVHPHFGLHPEVNANVFLALQGTDAERDLPATLINQWQQADGSFSSYFYPGNYYSAYTFVRYLIFNNQYWPVVKKVLGFIEHNQRPDGAWGNGVLDTAFALAILKICKQFSHHYNLGAKYLLDNKTTSGVWLDSQVVWRFLNTEENTYWNAYDVNGVITNAMCVYALK